MSESSESYSTPRIYYDPRAIDWFIRNVLRKKKYYKCRDLIKDCRKLLDLAQNYWVFYWVESEDNVMTNSDTPIQEGYVFEPPPTKEIPER
jgi:hypothetical protein